MSDMKKVERGQAAIDAAIADRRERPGAFGPEVTLINGAHIRPEPVDWLWDGWLAAGKLHVLAGAPGTGKTTLALALASSLTCRGRWPDGSRVKAAGSVLIWSGEDDPTDTLAPRLMACGADMSRIHFVGTVFDGDDARAFDPAVHMDALADSARRIGDVRLLICDPVVSAVAGDSHKNTEVRRALQPLVNFGHEHRAAVLGISHFSKGSQGRDPTERVAGSLAFGALARVVCVAAKVQDGDDESCSRILARSKSNIGPDEGGFKYDLEQTELPAYPGVFASRVLWGESIEGSAREILRVADAEQEPGDTDAENEVDAWLKETLSESGETPRKELLTCAKAAGFTERTTARAFKRIGGKSRTTGFGIEKQSLWSLPIPATHSCHVPTTGTNGRNGRNGTNEGGDAPFQPIVPLMPRSESGRNGGRNESWEEF